MPNRFRYEASVTFSTYFSRNNPVTFQKLNPARNQVIAFNSNLSFIRPLEFKRNAQRTSFRPKQRTAIYQRRLVDRTIKFLRVLFARITDEKSFFYFSFETFVRMNILAISAFRWFAVYPLRGHSRPFLDVSNVFCTARRAHGNAALVFRSLKNVISRHDFATLEARNPR